MTILEDNEIIAFETFPYGVETLIDMIGQSMPHTTSLQIENIICTSAECRHGAAHDTINEFLSYISDTIFAYLQTERIDIRFDSLLLYGNLFENTVIRDRFTALLQDTLSYTLTIERLHEHITPAITHDQAVVSGLSLMASELLLTRKDPLVRIMRYVLYQYE